MRDRKRWIALIVVAALCASAMVASAHASRVRSTPGTNSSLPQAPAEIRIWFDEPLEPNYSRIELRTANGERLALADSRVDEDDPRQLFVPLPELADGLYTVSWRVISAADGHPTQGSFVFGVGTAVGDSASPLTIDETVDVGGSIVRWLNLLSLSLMMGSIGFLLFVWQPISQSVQSPIDRLLERLIRSGWWSAGIVGILMLLLQASIAFDTSLPGALTDTRLPDFVASSAYGRLWLLRLELWIAGLVFVSQPRQRRLLPAALACGMGILLAQSLFSHASATADAAAAVAGDWLHLLATSLWIGGLIAFVVVMTQMQRHYTMLAAWVAGYFSNYARVALAALIITGSYAAWLQVGSLDALVNTVYGYALVLKLLLFAPLLLIAALNLVMTQRRLAAGQVVWVGRLRGLVSVEVVLTVGILAAAGVMTSGTPARNVQAQRELLAAAEALAPENADYFGMEIVNNEMIHLEIVPGYAGENTFYVTPFDQHGDPIDDATLVRLHFDNLDQSLGQTELRPTYDPEALAYTVTSNNLSTAGRWRIRMTVQRPGQADTVTDFEATIAPAPAQIENASTPWIGRVIAASLTGFALLGVGGFFVVQTRPFRWLGGGGLSVLCLVVGAICLGVGMVTFMSGGAPSG